MARARDCRTVDKAPADAGVSIFASHRFDPSAEDGQPGYWLEIGRDAPRERLFTGLSHHAPYVFCQAGFTAHSGDEVTFEARYRSRDPYSSATPEQVDEDEALAITLRLDVLRADSDGDGLTDIAETRLLSDPHVADTDGDGRPDDVDVNPVVPLTTGTAETDRVAIKRAVLTKALTRSDGLVIVASEAPFDIDTARFQLLTLSLADRQQYEARFGGRDIYTIELLACVTDPCPENSLGVPLPAGPYEEGAPFVLVIISGHMWSDYFEARKGAGGWVLTRVMGLVAQHARPRPVQPEAVDFERPAAPIESRSHIR